MTLNVIFVCKINDVLAERSATADEQALDELQALPAENKPKRRLMRISAIKTQKKHLNMRCFTKMAERQRLTKNFALQNFLNVDLAFWVTPPAYSRLPKSCGSNSFFRVRLSACISKQKKRP